MIFSKRFTQLVIQIKLFVSIIAGGLLKFVINGLFEINRPMNLTQNKRKCEQTQKEKCCPGCQKKATRINFYACCLQPSCLGCYDGFHFLMCKKKILDQNYASSEQDNSNKLVCERCEQQLNGTYYHCKQCNNERFCEECLDLSHGFGKFLTHQTMKSHTVFKQSSSGPNQLLKCLLHKKIRNIISQKCELVCSGCIPEFKIKKVKTIDFYETNTDSLIEDAKQRIEALVNQFMLKSQDHETKWRFLKENAKKEYDRMINLIKERYEQNLSTLNKIEEANNKIVQQTSHKAEKALKILEWCDSYQNRPNEEVGGIFAAHLNILLQQLNKQKRTLESTQIFTHKIGEIQIDKLQNVIKGFIVQKIRVKESDDKQNRTNGSLRKLNSSVCKLSQSQNLNSSLAHSRRSLSKSVSKYDDMRASTKNLKKSQPYDSEDKKKSINNNSSGKKNGFNANAARNSLLGNRMDESIIPMALSFDSKQFSSQSSIRSKINFASSKVEQKILKESEDNQIPMPPPMNLQNHNSVNSSMSELFTKGGKRKSDYFDLRERMRKPNAINNRFSRK